MDWTKHMASWLASLPDYILLHRATAGDGDSFETLFHRHYGRVYGLLFRLLGNRAEAEDVAQEVFLRLHQRPPRTADESANISAWLYSVAMNLGYNALRGRKRRWQWDTHLLPERQEPPATPAQLLEQDETQAAVRRALAQLPPPQAQLLLLRQMGLSYAELAQACGVRENSVGTLLARAAQAFQAAWLASQETS